MDIDHLDDFDRRGPGCACTGAADVGRKTLATHARLARRIATPVCLDESLDSPGKVVEALEVGACSVVCVKPSRLGGIGAALEVIRGCAASSVPVWIGGMFETGFARAANTTLAAASGSRWPGDLSPAGSYLRQDLTPPPAHPYDLGPQVPGQDRRGDSISLAILSIRLTSTELA